MWLTIRLGLPARAAYVLSTMRSLWAVLIYLCAVVLAGTLLAPWLFKLGQSFSHFAKDELHFYVQNSLLLVAVAGVWPLIYFQGMTNCRDIGLVNPLRDRKAFFQGLAFGLISLAAAAFLAIALGAREFRGHFEVVHLLGRVGGIILSALAVAVLEEVLFRGAIFGSLRKILPWGIALLLSSMAYAIVHFFAEAPWNGPVTWSSGLQILPAMLTGFLNFNDLIPAFLNLTLAGILLGLAYQRTGTLWFSIGIHAGWIFWIKFNMSYTNSIATPYHSFFGSNRMVNGWLATLVLAIALLIFLWLPIRRRAENPNP